MDWDDRYERYLKQNGVVPQCQAVTNEGKRCKNRTRGKYCPGLHAVKRYGDENHLKPGFSHFSNATDQNYSATYQYRPRLSKTEYKALMKKIERENRGLPRKTPKKKTKKTFSPPRGFGIQRSPSPKKKSPSPGFPPFGTSPPKKKHPSPGNFPPLTPSPKKKSPSKKSPPRIRNIFGDIW